MEAWFPEEYIRIHSTDQDKTDHVSLEIRARSNTPSSRAPHVFNGCERVKSKDNSFSAIGILLTCWTSRSREFTPVESLKFTSFIDFLP
jgi:hypothetical protein